MKTSEFIKYFKNEGYKVYKGNMIITVEDKNMNEIFDISENNNLNTYYIAFDNLSFTKKQEYYKVIFEYLMTPLEEREEEKKYYLRQIGIYTNVNFLNYDMEDKEYIVQNKKEIYHYKTQFTQSEINEMPECYTHPAVWTQVEVENEEEC